MKKKTNWISYDTVCLHVFFCDNLFFTFWLAFENLKKLENHAEMISVIMNYKIFKNKRNN